MQTNAALDPLITPVDRTLTPQQNNVLSLISDGLSITAAAERTGIHRNTIRNWRRALPVFSAELEFALHEQAAAWHEQNVELAPLAAKTVADLLNDPATAPAIRLRAALAILKEASALQPARAVPASAPPQIVQPAKTEIHAQSCTMTVRKAPEPARNSICPCGSGLKFKRCCASKMAAQSAQPAQSRTIPFPRITPDPPFGIL